MKSCDMLECHGQWAPLPFTFRGWRLCRGHLRDALAGKVELTRRVMR